MLAAHLSMIGESEMRIELIGDFASLATSLLRKAAKNMGDLKWMCHKLVN